MEHLRKAYDMLDRELEEIVNNGEMSKQTVDTIDELTHSMKSLVTIMAMHESEHGTSGRGYGLGRSGRGYMDDRPYAPYPYPYPEPRGRLR